MQYIYIPVNTIEQFYFRFAITVDKGFICNLCNYKKGYISTSIVFNLIIFSIINNNSINPRNFDVTIIQSYIIIIL